MRLRVFFRSKFGLVGASVRRCAEAHLPCPGGRLRGWFLLQVRLGRRKGRRCAEAHLPCMGGRLLGFFSLLVRLGRSKRAPVRRSAPSVPGRAIAGIFRSKFGLVGESGRQCAEARLPCQGGRLRGFFSLQVRLGRRKRAPVRRSAPSVPGRAVAGLFFAIRHVLKVLPFRT